MSDDPLEVALRASREMFGEFTTPLPDLVQAGAVLASLSAFGGGRSPVELYANDYEFVVNHGLTLDNRPFDFGLNGYLHMKPVYQDDAAYITMMAGAQTGKTGRLLVRLTRSSLRWWGSLFGYYFPDIHLPKAFSTNRLLPFWNSNPGLRDLVGIPRKSGAKGISNVLTRTLGESVVFLLTTEGKTATEGLPMRGTFFDEVRGMQRSKIELAEKRRSAQVGGIVDMKVSTARYPGMDIDYYFQLGDQRWFHTAKGCRCPDGVVLSLTWPDCIADLRGASPALLEKVRHAHRHTMPDLGESMCDGEYLPAAYICPACGEIIASPREGFWMPHNERSAKHSYQMPQLLSPTFPAGRVLYLMEHNVEEQILWNDMLGRPHVDETKRLCTIEDVEACQNPELQWWANRDSQWRRQNIRNTCAGVDVQAGYLVVVIKRRAANGKRQTVHLQIVHGDNDNDPWHTLGLMMARWDIDTMVMDHQPEFSSTMRFAKAFRGRVFLSFFRNSPDSASPIVKWGDAVGEDGLTRKDVDASSLKHMVTIEKVRAMELSMGMWKRRFKELPPIRELTQRLPIQNEKIAYSAFLRKGRWQQYAIGRSYAEGCSNVMKVNKLDDNKQHKERRDRRNEASFIIENLGHDHFADADVYADVALDRKRGGRGSRRLG